MTLTSTLRNVSASTTIFPAPSTPATVRARSGSPRRTMTRVRPSAESALPRKTTSTPWARNILVAVRATPCRRVPFSTSTISRPFTAGIT